MPARIATPTKTMSVPVGTANTMPYCERAARREHGEEHPDRDPERGADQGRDDALVPDHPAHLPPRHADRTQHSELSRSLEDREDERVDDAEQAYDHGQPEQRVQDLQRLS